MAADATADDHGKEPGSALTARLGAMVRPGTRLERVRSSHSYGFVLFLVIVSFVFIALAPQGNGPLAILTLIEAAILSVAIWTSGLLSGRRVIPVVLLVGVVAAAVALADGGKVTLGVVGGIEAVFLIASCAVIAAGVWDQQQVNKQSVLGALSIYVTIGILFTVVYSALAHTSDAAFFAQDTDGTPSNRLYFSFVTLATLGYGDYTAATDFARMLAVVEALIGQLYLVTVVALLVANLGRTRGEPRP